MVFMVLCILYKMLHFLYKKFIFNNYYIITANPDRVAVPLSGPGGKIAVLELKKTGRLPDGVMPALVHGATVMDFQWNPFDNQRLAVGKGINIFLIIVIFCNEKICQMIVILLFPNSM